MQISEQLKKYIEENILSQYDKNNVGGHGKSHIESVIARSFELAQEFNLDVNPNLVYAIASFHDIGYKDNPDEHEEVSSQMFQADSFMRKFFSEAEVTTATEAIVDHRASLEYEARSVYGKLVSSADREISVENMLERSILFQADKHRDEQPTVAQVIDYSYKKLSSKYGKGGYAKMYFPDKKYLDYLQRMQEILEDKEKFIQAELSVMNERLRKNKKSLELDNEYDLDI